MKVLHVITGLNVGGAELQLRSILQHTRHDADVITLYNPGPVAEMIRADGTLVRDLGMTRNTEVSALARLYRLIRDGRSARPMIRRCGRKCSSRLGCRGPPSISKAR